MTILIIKSVIIIMEVLISYFKSITISTDIQILLSQSVMIILETLSSFFKSVLIGIACRYLTEWLDENTKEFFEST